MNHKILLVDDEEAIHKIIKRTFKEFPFEFSDAYDGEEAVKIVSHFLPNLILLDVNMPKKDGYAVVREIRNNNETKNIPIIMLTGLGEVVDRVVGFELGVEDYMTKPFNVDTLKKHVFSFLK